MQFSENIAINWGITWRVSSETLLRIIIRAGGSVIWDARAGERKEQSKLGWSTWLPRVLAFWRDAKHWRWCTLQARIVVVASGALGTLPLLRVSGLRNPNIGKNLHLHLVRVAWGYFPPGDQPDGKCYQGDIISSMCKLGSSTIIQTPIFHPGAFASWSPWVSGRDMKERMVRYSRTASVFALVRDKGSGRVWKENYLSYKVDDASHDGENLARGLERALRILIAAGATEVGTYHSDGERFNVEGASQEEIEDFLGRVRRKTSFSTPHFSAHQMGSCRMGMDPATSCVDENGESWEVEGLFVSDASVLPTALGVNPMITVESVSLCISRRVSRFLRRTTP